MSSTNTNTNSNNDEEEQEEDMSAYLVLFSFLLTVVLLCSHLLQHRAPKIVQRFLPEAGLTLGVGMLASYVLHAFVVDNNANNNNNANNADEDELVVAQNLLRFSPRIFFLALLPPIIFNSGYHIRRALLFRHFVPISLLAVVGTVASALCIAGILRGVQMLGWLGHHIRPTFSELLTFGGLLSATDPVSTLAVFSAKKVDPQLFYLVFGESVLNDAVGLILFKSFARFVVRTNAAGDIATGVGEFVVGFLLDAVGSPILGFVCACAAALVFKVFDLRDNHNLELCLYVLIMYVPFLMAELVHLSGIVTILFTGMAAQAYILPNLSRATQVSSDVVFRLTAHLAETSIFLELGLSVFGLKGHYVWPLIGWTCVACLVARAVHVYPLCALYNQSVAQRQARQSQSLLNDFDERRERNGNSAASESNNGDGGGEHGSRRGRAENESHVEMTDLSVTQSDRLSNLEGASHSPGDTGGIRPTSPLAATGGASSLPPPPPSSGRRTNVDHDNPSIGWPTQHMVWFSGLRGAVAYACVRFFPTTFGHARVFTVSTMMVVLLSVFLLGGTTEWVLQKLGIDTNVDEEAYMQQLSEGGDGVDDDHTQRRQVWLERVDAFCQKYFVRDDSLIMVHKDDDADYYESSEAMGLQNQQQQQQNQQNQQNQQTDDTANGEETTTRKPSLFNYGKGD